jgi:hypothetical protein
MRMVRLAGWLACLGFFFASSIALAQDVGPDIVRLRSGGFVRGTVTELIPGSHVVVVTSDGTSHRFEEAEVEFAGPAPVTVAPATVAPVAPVAPQSVAAVPTPAAAPTSTFSTDDEALTLFHLGAGGYAPICELPCALTLETGPHSFGVSRDGGRMLPVDERFAVTGPSQFLVRWHGRGGVRAGGWVLLVAGALTGLGMALGGVAMMTGRSPGDGWALTGPGIGVGVLSIAIGIGLAVAGDSVDIDLRF